MNGRCCVFQPFDSGPYDKRYEDILDPAIRTANLEPYRVDKDPSATIPIDTLHEEIRLSIACLADITTDNPNVWYELGYAVASNKPMVMICSKSRTRKPPFDIQHRKIIWYALDSPRDFDQLKNDISTRLLSELHKQAEIQNIVSASSSVRETEGLKPHEISALALIMATRDAKDAGVSNFRIKQQMSEVFTDLATNLALVSLEHKGFIESKREQDYDGSWFAACFLTTQGEKWLLDHQDRLELSRS